MVQLACHYKDQGKYSAMEKYFLMAIDKDDGHAMYNYGLYYQEQKDYINMEKYYLMAIEKDNIYAMGNLAIYYYTHKKDNDNTEKYLLMAIEKGSVEALHRLGLYYFEQNDYENMKKYLLLAVEKGHTSSMCSLGMYYVDQKDYDNMLKYCLLAINKNDQNAVVINLLKPYYKKNTECITIPQIYMKGVQMDNTDLLNMIEKRCNLRLLYYRLYQLEHNDIKYRSIIRLLQYRPVFLLQRKIKCATKVDTCPICLDELITIPLECCHYYCIECYCKINKCAMCE